MLASFLDSSSIGDRMDQQKKIKGKQKAADHTPSHLTHIMLYCPTILQRTYTSHGFHS